MTTAEPRLKTVYRVRRFHRGECVRDYGEFDAWLSNRVAIRASEKYPEDIIERTPIEVAADSK